MSFQYQHDRHQHIANAFRELRSAWFDEVLRSPDHERIFAIETRDDDAMRETYDDETEAILRGENRPVAPQCWADLEGDGWVG